MHVRIRRVFELPRVEPAMRARQFLRLGHHARRPKRGRRQHDLRPEEAHQLPPLDTEAVCHRHDQRVALCGAHHRKSDPRVPARGLDDGLAGTQLTRLFSSLDDPERQPVLHRSQWIEGFHLDPEVNVGRGQMVDANDRRVTDGIENALKAGHFRNSLNDRQTLDRLEAPEHADHVELVWRYHAPVLVLGPHDLQVWQFRA